MTWVSERIEDYDAFADYPYMFCFREVDKMCPNSKFVLLSREPENLAVSDLLMWARLRIDAQYEEKYGAIPEKKMFVRRYQDHFAEVRGYFGQRKDLLVMSLEQDSKPYEKLARFLGFEYQTRVMPVKNAGLPRSSVAILLPIKPRSVESFRSDMNQLYGALKLDPCASFHVFIGYDENDAVLTNARHRDKQYSWKKLKPSNPFRICDAWNELAIEAYSKKFDWYILLGDDVTILRRDWYRQLYAEFAHFHQRSKVPFGVGCVVLREEGAPSWPSFPVVGRQHLDIFGSLFPTGDYGFHNQDADVFIFELYRRLGLSSFTRSIIVRNEYGGVLGGLIEPERRSRYFPVRTEWRGTMVHSWLSILTKKLEWINPIVTMDVAVPSYRLDMEGLGRIQSLSVPKDADIRHVVVTDRVLDRRTRLQLRQMELKNPRLRVRVNSETMGAPYSRNRAAEECHSDWLLFLDNDIVPDGKLLSSYVAHIRQAEKLSTRVRGFVGTSVLSTDGTLRTTAFHMAQLSFVWHIARWAELNKRSCPWGVTANLLFRWSPDLRFDVDFPRAGGGEDIDICITMGGASHHLRPAPDAEVFHPWWGEGRRWPLWRRLARWAIGDGLLLAKHPQFTYRTLPNFPEAIIAVLLVFAMCLCNPFPAIIFMTIMEFVAGTRWVYKQGYCPWVKGVTRVLCAMESCVPLNASDLGHTLGYLSRFELLNLTRRFDYFLGTEHSIIQKEKDKAAFHNVHWALGLLVCSILQYCNII
eukprot:Plantae.Rhodophyta-Hildenbrandia_rubra.ctg8245.p1 GENE.Plantae.Rhodophyta-Hildenbrandia_rubra.ctg8245~~Plantae.Rhodophyta-Hildenbrandia_rubra.ctg8245.p1  ORF type:complete len:754 (-),score=78.80 Plantae.Rhodophyta-Hildenbrandia_rubra.ctg8245:3095-5356(-)